MNVADRTTSKLLKSFLELLMACLKRAEIMGGQCLIDTGGTETAGSIFGGEQRSNDGMSVGTGS